MKNNLTVKIIVGFTISFFCFTALAGGATGVRKIGDVQITQNGSLVGFIAKGTPWDNPDNCGGTASASRIVLDLSTTANGPVNKVGQVQFSSVLAAVAAGKDVSSWVSGCIAWGGQQTPLIWSISTSGW